MLPEEFGDVISGAFAILFPDGQTIEELKQNKHNVFRDVGKYFEEKGVQSDGMDLL
jgi:hypothetical protein